MKAFWYKFIELTRPDLNYDIQALVSNNSLAEFRCALIDVIESW